MRELGPEAWFLTGFVATVMEGLNLFCSIPLDDNVLIPVGTGITLWLYTTASTT
jgi:dolichol kinase